MLVDVPVVRKTVKVENEVMVVTLSVVCSVLGKLYEDTEEDSVGEVDREPLNVEYVLDSVPEDKVDLVVADGAEEVPRPGVFNPVVGVDDDLVDDLRGEEEVDLLAATVELVRRPADADEEPLTEETGVDVPWLEVCSPVVILNDNSEYETLG